MPKTTIIAEAGVNHNGQLDLAEKLIYSAKEIGADMIKFQLFNADTLVTKNSEQAEYQKKNNKKSSQYEMLKELELTQAHFKTLKEVADDVGIDFMLTPFDLESVEFISRELNLPVIKIGSGDLTHGPLLLACAREQKDLIVSTGMSTLSEIEMALKIIAFGFLEPQKMPMEDTLENIYSSEEAKAILLKKVTLLHCTSEYPVPFNEVNLKAMDTMREAFQLNVGFSDHSLGIEIPLAAVARGATIIEKHFTLDKCLEGPDHKASIDVAEFQAMVSGIRNIEIALGDGRKCVTISERKNRAIVRRSLVAKQSIRQGTILTKAHIDIKRPAGGLTPMQYWQLLGMKAQKDYEQEEVLHP